MVKIVWTDAALADLEAIADYIALDKPDAASRFVIKVFNRIEILTQHPELGSWIPELPRSSRYRQSTIPPCRVFHRYDRDSKKILILGAMRGEKLFQRLLLEEREN